jgi:hypothetical protein
MNVGNFELFNESAGARGTFSRMPPAIARSGTAPTEKSASTGIGDQAAAPRCRADR